MYTADAADMEVKVPLKTYIKFGGFRFPQIKTSLTSKVMGWICNVVQQQLQAGGEVVHGHLLYGGN